MRGQSIHNYRLSSPKPSFCLLRLGWGKNVVVFQNVNVKVLRNDFYPTMHGGAMKTDIASKSGPLSWLFSRGVFQTKT